MIVLAPASSCSCFKSSHDDHGSASHCLLRLGRTFWPGFRLDRVLAKRDCRLLSQCLLGGTPGLAAL